MVRAARVATTLLLLATVPLAVAGKLTLAPGDPAPEMRGWKPTGERHILDLGKGKWTLVNYWATWCEPCKREMPILQGLHEKYPERLQILGVINDPIDDAALIEFLEALGVTYPNIRPQARYNALWASSGSLPTSYLIDPDGKVVRRYVGAAEVQTAGLVYDVEAVIDGRPLGPYVFAPSGEDEAGKPAAEAGGSPR